MKTFYQKYNNFKSLIESPEKWGDDDMESSDVVTFLYMIEPEAIASTPVGMFLNHANIMKYIKDDDFPEYIKVVGEFDNKRLFDEKNVIGGRLWLNNEKISLWEYTEGGLADDNKVRGIVKNILELLKKNYTITVNNYSIQVTPTLSDTGERVLN